ncbi:MAG: sterol desaturase family protein [Actinomycetota bacterium]|nr:sterol desaturase family protein [Actinomycetota bacterium]
MVHPGSAALRAPQEECSTSGIALALLTTVLLLGALALRTRAAFGIVALAAVLIPIERLFSLHPQRILRRGWATDVVHLVVDNLLSAIGVLIGVVGVGLALRAAVPSVWREAIAGQPAWLQFGEAFLLTNVAFYWAHRAAHSVPVLWRFHKVHHAITEMDWLASGHLHPIDQAIQRTAVVVPLFALGFSKATFGAFLVVTTLQAIFVHANVRLRFGPLRWLITTPEFHHWHHAVDPAARNRNFAGELPVLDRLFGTLYMPSDQWPVGYGLDAAEPGGSQPDGYVRQLAWPFRSGPQPSVSSSSSSR